MLVHQFVERGKGHVHGGHSFHARIPISLVQLRQLAEQHADARERLGTQSALGAQVQHMSRGNALEQSVHGAHVQHMSLENA